MMKKGSVEAAQTSGNEKRAEGTWSPTKNWWMGLLAGAILLVPGLVVGLWPKPVDPSDVLSKADAFLRAAHEYADAEEAAFNDTFFRHDEFFALKKGNNQRRYEDQAEPQLEALLDTLSGLCARSESCAKQMAAKKSELKRFKNASFSAYDAIEDLSPEQFRQMPRSKRTSLRDAREANSAAMLRVAREISSLIHKSADELATRR